MTYVARNITPYPANFPAPDAVSYAVEVDMGLVRSEERGFPDHARKYGVEPTEFSVRFLMTIAVFKQWHAWIDANAIGQWVKMPSVDQYNDMSFRSTLSDAIVRFYGYVIEPVGADHYQVSATVSRFPEGIGDGEFGLGGDIRPPSSDLSDWIIAKTPSDPSVDWYIAGSPGTPSVDTVSAQTPADHMPVP